MTVQITVHFSFAFQSFLGVLFGVGAKLGFETFSGVLVLEYGTANKLRTKIYCVMKELTKEFFNYAFTNNNDASARHLPNAYADRACKNSETLIEQ